MLLVQLQDYGKTPAGESEVKFSLSRVTLEPMLRSMAYIIEQLSTPVNKVALINLKVRASQIRSFIYYDILELNIHYFFYTDFKG